MFSSLTYVMLIITCEVLFAVTSLDSPAGKCELVLRSDAIDPISISMGPLGTCYSGKIDGFKECRGTCESSATYNKKLKDYEPTCQCCSVARYKVLKVPLTCGNNVTSEYDVITAAECSCKRCGDNTSPEKPSTSIKSTDEDY